MAADMFAHETAHRIAAAMVLAAGLCLGSCSPESDAELGQEAQSEPLPVNVPSDFAAQVGEQKYEETDPPVTPPTFRWDFSKPDVVYPYAYTQQVRSKHDYDPGARGKSADGLWQEISAEGLLLVKSQGDHTADLVLKDIEVEMAGGGGGKGGPPTMKQKAQPFVVQGMKEDGAASFAGTPEDMLLKLLFPLPDKPLQVGGSADIPAQMPFNAMGSVLQVKGRSRVTLTRYVRIGERTCARLDVDIDISELDVPEELEGEYGCWTKGKSVFYFDIAERAFVSGTVAFTMQFRVDVPTPEVEMGGERMPGVPERSKMAMTSDNLIHVELRE